MTEDEALALATRLLGDRRELTMHPFEFGWLVAVKVTEEDRASGRALGQARLIVDRDGTATLHPSLSTRMVIRQYTEARREGRMTGQQVWPEPTTP